MSLHTVRSLGTHSGCSSATREVLRRRLQMPFCSGRGGIPCPHDGTPCGTPPPSSSPRAFPTPPRLASAPPPPHAAAAAAVAVGVDALAVGRRWRWLR